MTTQNALIQLPLQQLSPHQPLLLVNPALPRNRPPTRKCTTNFSNNKTYSISTWSSDESETLEVEEAEESVETESSEVVSEEDVQAVVDELVEAGASSEEI